MGHFARIFYNGDCMSASKNWNGQLTKFTTLLISAYAVLISGADAQQSPDQYMKQYLNEAKKVVATCAAKVRNETNAQFGFNISSFNAYVKSDGTVAYLGTPPERFSFEKCMSENGQEMGEIQRNR